MSILFAVALVVPARAATVSIGTHSVFEFGGQMVFHDVHVDASSGEHNELRVRRSPDGSAVTVSDAVAHVTVAADSGFAPGAGTSSWGCAGGPLGHAALCAFVPGIDQFVNLQGESGSAGGFTDVYVNGGDRPDQIRTVDGSAEIVSCGDGHDKVVADSQDLVAADCEQVVRVG